MTAKARAHREIALKEIQEAQSALGRALDAASPLRGWCGPGGPYYAISAAYDATKDLWRQVAEAPVPTSHDSEPET